MKKKDLLLAQKTIAARQVKQEHLAIKAATLANSNRHARSTNDLSRSLNSPLQSSNSLSGGFGGSRSGLLGRTASTPALPNIHESQRLGSPTGGYNPQILSPKEPLGERKGQHQTSVPNENDRVVQELSKRAVTAKTGIRKLQTEVKKRMEQQKLEKTRAASAAGSSRGGSNSAAFSASLSSTAEVDSDSDNMFMPKKTIQRSDGATLSDIYASKKEDAWGQILKAQLRDEEEMNKLKRKQQEQANEQYGAMLKRQVEEIRQRQVNALNANNDFAALEGVTAKRTHDLQKRREQEAIDRQKRFIAHALEDIETKRQTRERFLTEELTASTVMIDKAKAAIRQAELKKLENKEYNKSYQDSVMRDNSERLARKAKEKADSFAEDRRIIAENERQFQKEQKRRQEDLARKMNRTTEGPAHFIVQRIIDDRRRHEENFFETRYRADNMLNKQLQMSEEAARARLEQNGADLTVEWLKHAEWKEKKKLEDDKRNDHILNTMKKLLADQEAEDIAKRRAQVEAASRYQRELDEQLSSLRQRSHDSLAKTMSEQEMLYNSDLLKKTKVEL